MSKPVKPKTKIVLNPVEGQLDVVTDNNFSYEETPPNKQLKIRENHQMTLIGKHQVDGILIIDGTLVVTE